MRNQLNEDNFAKSESEKFQSQFQLGDKVIVVTTDYNLKDVTGGIGVITKIMPHGYHIKSSTGKWFVKSDEIELYTEPETKTTEDMETKKLNLCELLAGHEDEEFYSLSLGEVTLKKIENNIVLCFINEDMDEPMYVRFDGTARYGIGGVSLIFPSRALYEQYPLDPYTAWMKWKEELLKCKMYLMIEDECNENFYADSFIFRIPADRDKCIKEIKAIIDKYAKEVEK